MNTLSPRILLRVLVGAAAGIALLFFTGYGPAWWVHADPHPHPAQGPLHFTSAQQLQIDGGHFGAPPKQVDARSLAGPWREVRLPINSLPRLTLPGSQATGLTSDVVTTWYRFHVPTDRSLSAAQAHEVMLYLPRWQTVGQLAIYGDGQLLYRSRGTAQLVHFIQPLIVPLAKADGDTLPSDILIRMTSERATGAGMSSVWVGLAQDLQWRWRIRTWLQQDLPHVASVAFLFIGLFALAVWAVRPREVIYFWFFITSALYFVRRLTFYVSGEEFNIPAHWFVWLNISTAGWSALSCYYFAFRVNGMRFPRFETALLLTMSALTVVGSPLVLPPAKIQIFVPLGYAVTMGMILAASTLSLVASWRSRSRDGVLLTIWCMALVPVGIHDFMLHNHRLNLEDIYLLPYLMMTIFVIFMILVYQRYANSLVVAENANIELDKKLKAREQELEISHEKLRVIERREILSEERRRLMQDMHDGMGSSLVTALRMVERNALNPQDFAQVLTECIDDLKLALDAMETEAPDLLSILGTLRFRIGRRLKASGMELVWQVKDVPPLQWLNGQSALHILRILQEVLTNIVKHAQARRIVIATDTVADRVEVMVEDDGNGFEPAPPAEPRPAGRGLANLQRRARALSAEVRWTKLTDGTRFVLSLPVDAGAPATAELARPTAG